MLGAVTLPIGDAKLISALDAKMGLEILELTADRVVCLLYTSPSPRDRS